MRRHKIVCSVTGRKEAQYLQYLQSKINEYAVMCIERSICGGNLSRQEQIYVLEELLNRLKTK